MADAAERIVPLLPPPSERIRVVIDTDAATEIDDLYALALAFASPQRFAVEGLVATHFAQTSGRESIEQSFRLLLELLDVAGLSGNSPVLKGGDPIRYPDEPSRSEGADFIIERARVCGNGPLWVVGLGAASNIASSLMLVPDIAPLLRIVYHARSEQTWPQRSEQFNVCGDVWAARKLLSSGAPLVWFDTGDQLRCPMSVTEERLAPCGRLGRFLHDYRNRNPYFQTEEKGFFDLGDIAWMIDPTLCQNEVVGVPSMQHAMIFDWRRTYGEMLRVHHIDAVRTWELFFERMAVAFGGR